MRQPQAAAELSPALQRWERASGKSRVRFSGRQEFRNGLFSAASKLSDLCHHERANRGPNERRLCACWGKAQPATDLLSDSFSNAILIQACFPMFNLSYRL